MFTRHHRCEPASVFARAFDTVRRSPTLASARIRDVS
jgi:hypothetical protein